MEELLDDIAGKIRWYTYPIYGKTLDGRLVPNGTGVIMCIGFDIYLVTAAHLLNRLRNTTYDSAPWIFRRNKNREIGNKNDFIRLPGQIVVSEDTSIDIGFVKIDNQFFRDSKLISLNESVINFDIPRYNTHHYISGYSISRSKEYRLRDKKKHSVESVCYGYGAIQEYPDWDTEKVFRKDLHIISIYEQGIPGNEYTTRKSPPRKGFSGGPLWSTPGFYENEDLKLEGILTTQKDQNGEKYVVATSAKLILDCMTGVESTDRWFQK